MAKITRDELSNILNGITFGPSGVMLDKMDLRWDVEEVHQQTQDVEALSIKNLAVNFESHSIKQLGWRIRFSFVRPDTTTGEMARGHGRWEFVDIETSESTVVKTCWLLLELLVRHELMEAFHYGGVRVFDPHRSIDDLALPKKLRGERHGKE